MSSLLISAPSLGVYYCHLSTIDCLSVCLSQKKLQIASFLFPYGIEPFLTVSSEFSMTPCTKRSSIFDLAPPPSPNAKKIYSPKFFCSKSPISRLVWQIDRRCLGLRGGFRGWPIQWHPAKCCGADHCCHSNEISARRGDPVAYRLVLLITRLSTCPLTFSIIRLLAVSWSFLWRPLLP